MKTRSLFSIDIGNGNKIKLKAYTKFQAKFFIKQQYGLDVDISMITNVLANKILKWEYQKKLSLIDAYKHEADICSGLVDP
jgi:hypothetical protein